MWTWELALAIAAVAGALVLARFWRGAEHRVGEMQVEIESLRESAGRLDAKLSREAAARRRQADELASLRKKSDKAKRRQSKPPEQPLGTLARMRDHEAQIVRLERDRDRVSAERDQLEAETARLRARFEAARAASAPATDETDRALGALRAELAAERERAGKLDEELAARRMTEARLRKRMENQEQLYASMRAELDVKKDRLRTQEEQLQRLQALKVAVLD